MTLVALVQSDCNTTHRTYQNKIREHNLVVLPDWTSLKQLVVVSSWVLEDHIKSHLSNMDSCPYPYEWANVKLVHPPFLGRFQYMIALGALNLDLLLTKANHETDGIEGSGHCISKNIIIWLTFLQPIIFLSFVYTKKWHHHRSCLLQGGQLITP